MERGLCEGDISRTLDKEPRGIRSEKSRVRSIFCVHTNHAQVINEVKITKQTNK